MVTNNALCFSAEPGLQRNFVQDGSRGLAAPQLTPDAHHPDCPPHAALTDPLRYHPHQPAQRRSHAQTLLGQVQHAHISRYAQTAWKLPCDIQ